LGNSGLVAMALSAVDVACWDVLAQAANVPLVRLLGGVPRALPAYNSNGLGLNSSAEAAAEEALSLLADGFDAIKIRLGYPTLRRDLEVLHAVRAAVGPDTWIACDYNQGLDKVEALRRTSALDAERLAWIEEPIAHDDFDGNAQIARACVTPIQIGENLNGIRMMESAIGMQSSDLVMPDLERIGGVSGWMRAAAIAAAHNIPMSSHLFPELSAHLLAVTPTADRLEYVDWAAPILAEPLSIEDGRASAPERAGNGLTWNEEAIARWAIE
jgi:mandelate racemase